MVTFIAGPDVKNLAQVQKGDEVTIEYGRPSPPIKKASDQTRRAHRADVQEGRTRREARRHRGAR